MPTDKEFEDILRNRFDDFEDEPPLEGWNKLRKDLTQHRSPRKRWPFSLLAILLLIGLGWQQPTTKNRYALPPAATAVSVSIDSASKNRPETDRTQQKEKAEPNGHKEAFANMDAHSAILGAPSPDTNEESRRPTQTLFKQNELSRLGQHKLPQTIASEWAASLSSTRSDCGTVIQSRLPKTSKDEVETRKAKKTTNEALALTNSSKDSLAETKIINSFTSIQQKTKFNKTFDELSAGRHQTFSIKDRSSQGNKSERLTRMSNHTTLSPKANTADPGISVNTAFVKEEKSPNVSLSFVAGKSVRTQPNLTAETVFRRIDSVLRTQPVAQVALVTKAKPKPDSSYSVRPSGRWPYAFGIYVSPRYAFSRFTPNQEDNLLIESIHTEDKPMRTRLGYEAGLTGSRLLSDRLVLNGSLVFIHLNETLDFSGISTKPDSVTWVHANDGSSTVTPHFNSHQQRYESSYQYAGLNIGASCSFWKRKQGNWYTSAGGGLNVLVKGKTHVYKDNTFVETIRFPSPKNPLEQINYRLSMGIGYAHRIGEHTELTFEPTLSYFLGSSFKEREPVGMKPYTLGLNIGLRFGR